MGAIKQEFAVLIALFLSACAVEDQQSLVVEVDPMQWREAAHFSIINSDTLSLRDISIFARYKFTKERVDSLPLHVVTTAPDQRRVVEQFTIYFDHNPGRQWERRLYREVTYRERVVFNQSGEYKIMIYPQQPAYGVEAIGVAIKPTP